MHVLICGAGIAGPTLAYFLAKSGNHVTLVEKAPSLLSNGQNIDIQAGSALSILRKMGLMDEIRRSNTTEKGTNFVDSNGKTYASFPVKKGVSASLTSEFEILRGDLAIILYNAAKDHPNVTYLFGTTINHVISNDDASGVEVELSNGETRSYDLLVAADGQWSRIRKQRFPPSSVQVIDKGMYAVYWTIPRLPSDDDWWNIYQALNSKNISLRPDPHGTIRAMFTLMPRNPTQKKAWAEASKSDKQAQLDLLRREFAGAGWQAGRLLDSIDKMPEDYYFQAIQQIKLSKWSTSRIVCLGDAAHAPSPLTGMGTSLALIGSYVLAGELSKLNEHEPISNALESYESTFRPFVEKVQNIPFFVPGVAHPKTVWGRWVFRSVIWTISTIVAIPWLTRWLPSNDSEDEFPLPQYDVFEEKESTRITV